MACAIVDVNRAPGDLPPHNPDGVVKTVTVEKKLVWSDANILNSEFVDTLLSKADLVETFYCFYSYHCRSVPIVGLPGERLYLNWLPAGPGTGLERSDTAPYDQTGHIAEFPEGGQYLPPPAHPHALAWTENGYYRPGDEITVFFQGLPGNEYDWISLASVDYNDQTYLWWSYTQGNRSGFKSFAGLEAGEYEVRVYYDWSSGGYTVHSRYLFTIAEQIPEKVTVKRTPVETEPPSLTTLAWTRQSCYAPGVPITVDFRGLSGNRHDWVSIAEVGSLERSYLHWSYTDGIREGSLSFPCLEPGEYEIRVYF